MQKHVVQRRYFTCQFITSNLEFFLLSMEGKEYHQKQLVKHCRVCEKVVKGYAHSVKKEHKNLLAVAGINTNQDSKEVHPNMFCNSRYLTLRQIQAAELSSNVRQHYVLFSGSPTKRAVQYAVTLHHLREEGDQEAQKSLW